MSRSFKTNYLKKQRQRYFKKIVWFLIFAIIIVATSYLVIFSNVFRINHVRILGIQRVPEVLVKKEINFILNENNILPLNNNLIFINTSRINKILISDVSRIYATRNFFAKTLNVHVIEKQPIARIVFESNNDSAFVNITNKDTYLAEDGRVFKSDLLDNDKIAVIKLKQQNTNIPSNLLDKEKVDNFIKLANYLKSKPEYTGKYHFEYSLNTPSSITASIKDLFNIYLTLNANIIEAFNTANDFYLKDDKNKSLISSYIDMRFYPEKLYYK